MVKETKQIVEDYILYKIHSACIDTECQPNGYKDILKVQERPSKLNLAIRRMADKHEQAYQNAFRDLIEQIKNCDISTLDVNKSFSHVAKLLLPLPDKPIEHEINRNYVSRGNYGVKESRDNISWGHVLGLLVYAGLLSVRAIECRSFETIDQIVNWITAFFDTDLSMWLDKQGGWAGFYEWSKATVGRLDIDPSSCGSSCSSGIQTAMRMGVVAACVGIGALLMSKK